MKLYFQYAAMHVRSAMQYKLGFVLSMAGQFFSTLFTFLAMYLLFERFGSIQGYSFGEVAVCFGVINVAFALTQCFARGFDVFSRLIVRGDFDRYLLRPRALALQVLGADFELTRIGRVAFSFVVLAIAVVSLETTWTFARALTMGLMCLGGTAIMAGVYILGATMCFFTVQGLEVINIFTDGGREIAGYPLTIYFKGLTYFFTFVIPFGMVNYLPLRFVAGQSANPAYMLLPLLGALFLIPSIAVWYWGARHYLSTGS